MRFDKKKKKWLWITIVIICVIVIAAIISAGLLYFRFKPQKPDISDSDITIYDIDPEMVKTDSKTGIQYVSNMVIVFFEESASEEDKQSVIENMGGTVKGSIPVINQYQIEISQKSYDELKSICDNLIAEECVDSAVCDIITPVIENDAPTNDKWWKGYDGGDFTAKDKYWWSAAIDMPGALEYRKLTNNTAIGIIDNGFDTGHKDLKGRITVVGNNNTIGKHGTHVAGIIGATSGNKSGISGVVWNPDMLCYPTGTDSEKIKDKNSRKMTDDIDPETINGYEITADTATSTMAQFALLLEKGAKVINYSKGLDLDVIEKFSNGNSEPYTQLSSKICAEYIKKFIEAPEIGDFLIVQSAGNNSRDATDMGMFCGIKEGTYNGDENVSLADIRNHIIIVGNAKYTDDNTFVIADSSNRGDAVDIFAPGTDIYSTIPGDFWDMQFRGAYGTLSGTSMAAPMVTGVSAMVWSVNPELTASQVKKIVCSKDNTKYEVKNPDLSETKFRLLNAKLAVEAAVNGNVSEDASDWKSIYKNFLLEAVFEDKDTARSRIDPLVALLDLNGDEVPELLYYPGNASIQRGAIIQVFAIEDGLVQYEYEGPGINPDDHYLYRDNTNKKNLLISGFGIGDWYHYYLYGKTAYTEFVSLKLAKGLEVEFEIGSDKVTNERFRTHCQETLKNYTPVKYSFEDSAVVWYNSLSRNEKSATADKLIDSYVSVSDMKTDASNNLESKLAARIKEYEVPDNGKDTSDGSGASSGRNVIFSSEIGEVNGETYSIRDVKSLKILPVNTYGKEISSFCSYNGYVYYILTDAGSDGYSTWLYRCTTDWNDETLLDNINFDVMKGNGIREFIIDNNILYYDAFGEDNEVTCINLSDMSKGKAVCPKYSLSNDGVIIERTYASDCNIYICNGTTYFTDANKNLYKMRGNSGTLIAKNAFLDGGYANGYLYYSEWDLQPGSEAYLYKISDNGDKTLVDSVIPAGGGGPFFCW